MMMMLFALLFYHVPGNDFSGRAKRFLAARR